MSLPAFATLDEFTARQPGGVADDEEDRALAALEDVSAVIRVHAGLDWTIGEGDDVALDPDVPDVVKVVCIAAARRVFENPDGIQSESVASYSASWANPSGDVYLTASEKAMITRAAGGGGVATLATTRGPLETVCAADDLLDPTVEELPIFW